MSNSNITAVNSNSTKIATDNSILRESQMAYTNKTNSNMTTILDGTLSILPSGELLYNYGTEIGDYSYSESTSSIVREIMNTKMPTIANVEILIPGKVVKVTFDDGKFEKAVCHENDKFDMEVAIGICIAKHLCGGSSKYHKLVNKGVKVYNNACKAEEEARIEAARIEAKRKKYQEKKMRRLERKANAERAARIQEQAEAIKLAHEMMNPIPDFNSYPEELNEE